MDVVSHILYPLSRWLHLVSMTLIVGGTLFYEYVVPAAIEDLRDEQQLYVFARARWVFRWVVYISAAFLVLTGTVSFYRMWPSYTGSAYPTLHFAMAHVAVAVVAVVIALYLTIGRHPPVHPVRWMRVNLVLLLVAIFLGNVTRHVYLSVRHPQERAMAQVEELQRQLNEANRRLLKVESATQPSPATRTASGE